MDYALSTQWAITEQGLQSLGEIYLDAIKRGGSMTQIDLQNLMNERESIGKSLHMTQGFMNSISVKKAERLRGTNNVMVVDDIALVELMGPIYPRANMMTMSGATSLQEYVSDFAKAYNNPSIKGIKQVIDSPGGDVRGLGDATKAIRRLMGQNLKPVESFATGYMASAAYYIGATGSRLSASEGAMAGSIGTIMQVMKSDKNVLTIVSSQSPNKRPDPDTDEGRAMFQEQVDDHAALFIKDVAILRGVTKDFVMENYGQGKLFVGPRAKKQGLIDSLSTLDQEIEKMARDTKRSSVSVGKAAGWSDETINSAFGLIEEDVDFDSLVEQTLGSEESEGHTDALEETEENREMGLKDIATKFTNFLTGNNPEANSGSQDSTIVTGKTRTELEEDFSSEAELFATQMMMSNNILPSEAAFAASDFLTAKLDDALHGGSITYVGADNEVVEGSRVEAVKARYENRPAHGLTVEKIKSVAKTSQISVLAEHDDEKLDAENKEVTPERKSELLGLTDLGEAARKNAAGK